MGMKARHKCRRRWHCCVAWDEGEDRSLDKGLPPGAAFGDEAAPRTKINAREAEGGKGPELADQVDVATLRRFFVTQVQFSH